MAAASTLDDSTYLERPADFEIEEFLAEEREKDLLRFSTAGSVDDGKSTLIGRLLYDTQNVYDDQVRSIEGKGSAGAGQLDLALLTDGLRAEREQGITIDVAYRYFSTAKRKFIIADTPGHEQYTRNMATGASTADVAIVLIDARKGVLIQSRRHAFITSLLGVRHVILAINKMDLVGYDQKVFEAIRAEFLEFYERLGGPEQGHQSSQLYFVPVSALAGDNVARRSDAMPWYDGASLLDLLESIPSTEASQTAPFRLAVQRVIRPHQNFRGFAGQIASGTVRPGQEVMVLPSRQVTRVQSIVTFDGELAEAQAPLSISLTLEDEVDISRGDLLVDPETPPATTRRFTASLVWMDEQALNLSRRYLLKHTSRSIPAQVKVLHHIVDIATLEQRPGTMLAMNGIGLVEIEALRPLSVDRYTNNRITGSFVLIDQETNATVAAGMIRDVLGSNATSADEPVSVEDRAARWGHSGAHIELTGPASFADAFERVLFDLGAVVVRADSTTPAVIAALTQAGALVITLELRDDVLGARLADGKSSARFDGEGSDKAEERALAWLRGTGVLQTRKGDR